MNGAAMVKMTVIASENTRPKVTMRSTVRFPPLRRNALTICGTSTELKTPAASTA